MKTPENNCLTLSPTEQRERERNKKRELSNAAASTPFRLWWPWALRWNFKALSFSQSLSSSWSLAAEGNYESLVSMATHLPAVSSLHSFFSSFLPSLPTFPLSAFSLSLRCKSGKSATRLHGKYIGIINFGANFKKVERMLGKDGRKAERGHFNGKEVIIAGHSRWNAAESFDD